MQVQLKLKSIFLIDLMLMYLVTVSLPGLPESMCVMDRYTQLRKMSLHVSMWFHVCFFPQCVFSEKIVSTVSQIRKGYRAITLICVLTEKKTVHNDSSLPY